MEGVKTVSIADSIRVIGFCGVDNSVSPLLLKLISQQYGWVEWGILFRTDKEGQSRYPTFNWVEELSRNRILQTGEEMRLAGHLCGDRCQEVLEGNSAFVKQLSELGFRRIQINATAANNVLIESERYADYVANIQSCMIELPAIEWIIQCNNETKFLWEDLLKLKIPNMSILHDASCGLGVEVTSFPSPLITPDTPCGYAGGIGPNNIENILQQVLAVAREALYNNDNNFSIKPVWIDMESSLRVKQQQNSGELIDIFSINKCCQCIEVAIKLGF
eukprot:gene7212-9842_t